MVAHGEAGMAQNCTAGFFCEAGSNSPVGMGLCPRGFYCPTGTAVPIPSPKGHHVEILGALSSQMCLAGYYAPTIETVDCYPCPPGLMCEPDGSSMAVVCGPGTFRGILETDTVVCQDCPQGTWSKQFELRDRQQCTPCAPGVVCPEDGMVDPCSFHDFPMQYTAVERTEQALKELDRFTCPRLADHYWGVLLPPIDSTGRSHLFDDSDPLHPDAWCYTNPQPNGSIVYQRMRDYYGPLHELQRGNKSQGYGQVGVYNGQFGFGSLFMHLHIQADYDPFNLCEPGFFRFNDTAGEAQWHPGTCEADIICATPNRSRAEPCSEGYVCPDSTGALSAGDYPCNGGFVCDYGTTPDVSLLAPQSQFDMLCPAGYFCLDGTGPNQMFRRGCPPGYFCPTGTFEPLQGKIANDAMLRGLNTTTADPTLGLGEPKLLPGEKLPRRISAHDQRCFDSIDPLLQKQFRTAVDGNGRTAQVSLAVDAELLCARDHKWRTVLDAVARQECNCTRQVRVLHEAHRLWACTDKGATHIETVNKVQPRCEFWVTSGASPLGPGLTILDADVDSTPVEERQLWTRERLRGIPSVLNGWNFTDVAVRLPPPHLGPSYFRSCGHLQPVVNCSRRGPLDLRDPCPAFCSFREFKEWTDAAYLLAVDDTNPGKLRGASDRIDAFLFDSKWAVDLLDDVRRYERRDQGDDDAFSLRDELPERVSLVQGKTPHGTEGIVPLRYDHCRCQDALRCPNGTTSGTHATSIFDCKKTGNEVLRRAVPIPDEFLLNATDRPILSGLFSRSSGVGVLPLKAHQVAVLTLDLRELSVNFTWDAHYQLSIYADCTPCPPRYVCDYVPIPPVCEWPPVAEQVGFGSMCADCCNCQRKRLPYWLETNKKVGVFEDNKHTFVQIQISALRDTVLTVALELLHGLYYGDFERDMKGVGELHVFTPARAKYAPNDLANRRVFLALLERTDFEDVALPLNLPVQLVRVMGQPNEFEQAFENDVLIDRPADLLIGHPSYFASRTERLNASVQPVFGATGGVSSPAALAASSHAALRGRQSIAIASRSGPTRPESLRRSLLSAADVEGANPDGDFLYQSVMPDGPWVPRNQRYRPQPDVTRDPSYLVEQDSTWWTNAENTDTRFLYLPYLPWFSSCEGYDSHISIAKLMEDHPACIREPYASTQFVDPYFWNLKFDAVADRCYDPLWTPPSDLERVSTGDAPGVPLYCYYEENIFQSNPLTRWFELEDGQAAFYLTKEPVEAQDFEANALTGERWGRTNFLGSIRGTEKVVPVEVSSEPEKSLVPRLVGFTLDFFQVSRGYKRLVRAELSMGEYCTASSVEETVREFSARGIPPCTPGDYNFTLEFKLRPLGWLELLNLFEFGADVYLIAFILIGLVTILLGALVWAIHRVATRLRSPPVFRFTRVWNSLIPSPSLGVTLASVPVMAVLGFVLIWFVHMGAEDPADYPAVVNFEDLAGSWLDTQVLTEERISEYKQGRIGAAFACFGLIMLFAGARTFIPDHLGDKWSRDDATVEDVEEAQKDESDILPDGADLGDDEPEPSPLWIPVAWRRSHMVLFSLAQMIMLLVVLEFAYSDSFAANQYLFIVLFKLAQVFMELFILSIVGDALQVCPMIVTIQMTEILVTMGADTFTDFVIAFFVESSVMMFERIYLDPNVKSLKAHWPLIMARLGRCTRKNRSMTREQRLEREKEWAKVVEHVKLETHGVEPLLESMVVYSNETVALLISPWLQLILLACDASPLHTLQITEIPRGFSIRETDLVFYTIFAIVSIPAQMAMDMFLINTQELVHGWKLYEYVAYQKYRFRMRTKRWQMDDERLDGSISSKLQTLDSLCFSSQFYAMSAFHAWGIAMVMIGIQVMLRKEYNMFGDVAFGIILLVMWLLFVVLRYLLIALADAVGLWKIPRIEGSIDDELAAKLAIGEGDLQDLEMDRMELKFMNSESFRVRFLEQNRPWLVQHLIELLTPRTLEVPQADGTPTRQYVKGVYNRLMSMLEDLDVRSDVSTPRDEDDGDQQRKRKWKADADPPSATSREIMREWLGKARRRILYKLAVADTIEAAKRDACDSCGLGEAGSRKIRVELATKGVADPGAMSALITAFEASVGNDTAKMSVDAWRAFFRSHARFTMVCTGCQDKQRLERVEARRAELFGESPAGNAGRRRADSEELDDEVPLFEPMTVDRSAPWGRIMSKWLRAVRSRLGGTFPRPEARGTMEEYAQKMREARAKRAKQSLERRRAELRGAAYQDPSIQAARGAADKVAGQLAKLDAVSGLDGDDADPVAVGHRTFGRVHLSAPARAMAIRWWQAARGVRAARERLHASKAREELDEVLASMRPEDTWYYTQARINEGVELAAEGESLDRQRQRMEAQLDAQARTAREKMQAAIANKEAAVMEAQASADAECDEFEASAKSRLEAKLGRIEERRQAELAAAAAPDGPASLGPRDAVPPRTSALLEALDAEEAQAREASRSAVDSFRAKKQEPVDKLRKQTLLFSGKVREAHAIHMGQVRRDVALQLRRLEERWLSRSRSYVQSAKRLIEAKAKEDARASAAGKRPR
ncbi:hypothetical protein FNF29_00857 [Cafeteria roenbergensis]|uniref:Tyrosine-protein kinase ephrin type A/B receptor-like domain-containing protein n=2 Tax=Cafeteria roenbergensis TaxID=33653 RepID=A0A5A8CUJ8_CAFRO|nr:hypothetical protein FNF29_00857 [Cafeteria roenbergensis]|eukprot:KAA0156746.1 hypothetical protein FNF29_00857 [Cafeteria roenbergensis]